MNSPFQPLSPTQQVGDTISECTQIMIDLEQLTSNSSLTSTLEDLFNNAAEEYNYGQKIGSVGLSTVTQAVNTATSAATSLENTWEGEALTAESLTVAASAAQLAAAVFSWAPGVNLCIDATAMAAYVAAQLLQNAASTAENTVISYIQNFNNEVLSQPGMSDIQSWNSAIQKNVLNFKALSLGATEQQIQATLMAITDYLISENQDLTVANYGNVIYGVATTMANNSQIDAAWKNAMAAISANPTPAEIHSQAAALNASFPQAWSSTVMVMSIFTSIMTIVDIKTWMTVRKVFQFNFVDTGNVNVAQELTDNDPQVLRLGQWSSRLKAFGAVVNIATIVMGIIAIIDTVNAASQMTSAISQASAGISDYLTQLVNSENAQQTSETGQS